MKQTVPAKTDVVFLPIGTIEAHGCAALGTDNFIPEEIAKSQAERLNAMIAPILNYGITKSLYRYPGSLTIKPSHFKDFVGDIIDSLVDVGFKYIFIVNGHGGNNAELKAAAYEKHMEHRVHIAVVHWWEMTDDVTSEVFGEAGGHAGNNETACVQALDPALVDAREFSKEMGYHMKRGADIYPVPGTILLYEENQGYPTFDLEQSKKYLTKMCDAVGEFMLDILNRWKKANLM